MRWRRWDEYLDSSYKQWGRNFNKKKTILISPYFDNIISGENRLLNMIKFNSQLYWNYICLKPETKLKDALIINFNYYNILTIGSSVMEEPDAAILNWMLLFSQLGSVAPGSPRPCLLAGTKRMSPSADLSSL